MELKGFLKDFLQERDAILIAGDVERMCEFHNKHNPGQKKMVPGEVAEIALHKARTGATSIPMELRRESKNWLTARGYESMDDGDV